MDKLKTFDGWYYLEPELYDMPEKISINLKNMSAISKKILHFEEQYYIKFAICDPNGYVINLNDKKDDIGVNGKNLESYIKDLKFDNEHMNKNDCIDNLIKLGIIKDEDRKRGYIHCNWINHKQIRDYQLVIICDDIIKDIEYWTIRMCGDFRLSTFTQPKQWVECCLEDI